MKFTILIFFIFYLSKIGLPSPSVVYASPLETTEHDSNRSKIHDDYLWTNNSQNASIPNTTKESTPPPTLPNASAWTWVLLVLVILGILIFLTAITIHRYYDRCTCTYDEIIDDDTLWLDANGNIIHKPGFKYKA